MIVSPDQKPTKPEDFVYVPGQGEPLEPSKADWYRLIVGTEWDETCHWCDLKIDTDQESFWMWSLRHYQQFMHLNCFRKWVSKLNIELTNLDEKERQRAGE